MGIILDIKKYNSHRLISDRVPIAEMALAKACSSSEMPSAELAYFYNT